jgi:hypothetical protein
MTDIKDFIDELYISMGYSVRNTTLTPDQYHRLLDLGWERGKTLHDVKIWAARLILL